MKKIFPPDPDLTGMLHAARRFFNAGQFREALELCRIILEQEPGDPEAHWLAGRSLIEWAEPERIEQVMKGRLEI